MQWFKDGSAVEGATNPTITKADVTVDYAGKYKATFTNASGSTDTKEVTVEVIDISVDTKGIGGSVKVGETKTDELVVYGEKPAGATVAWSADYDSGQENSFTLKPNADGTKCDITGVTAGGGGSAIVTVTYKGLTWSGKSRLDVVAADPAVKS